MMTVITVMMTATMITVMRVMSIGLYILQDLSLKIMLGDGSSYDIDEDEDDEDGEDDEDDQGDEGDEDDEGDVALGDTF